MDTVIKGIIQIANDKEPIGNIIGEIIISKTLNLEQITTKLVTDPSTSKSYALKAIRKNQVVELGQQSHILNEKRVMQMLDNKFLVNLRATYKDEFRVYFLLEVCLGGELFTILRKMRSFDEMNWLSNIQTSTAKRT